MNPLQHCLYEYRTNYGDFPTYQELLKFNTLVMTEGIERGIKLGLYMLNPDTNFIMTTYLLLAKGHELSFSYEKNQLLDHLEKYRNGNLKFPQYYELTQYATIIEYYGIIKGLEIVESHYPSHEKVSKMKELRCMLGCKI